LKICPKCGEKFPGEYTFCTKCGVELRKFYRQPQGKGKRIKAESVSIMPGQRREAEAAIGRFFGELKGDVVGMLAYIDETTFAYLSGIENARSFKILTSSLGSDRAKVKEAARALRRPVEVYELTLPRKGTRPRAILHERWISDGKLFVDLGTDLKSSALGHTQHTIRLEPARNHGVELDTFNQYWERIQAGNLEEAIGKRVALQHIIYQGSERAVTTLKGEGKRRKERAPGVTHKPGPTRPPLGQPSETEEARAGRGFATEPVEEPHVEERPIGGGRRGAEIPQRKASLLADKTSLVEFAVGLAIIWASLLVIAIPSVLFSVPAEIEKFIPEFFFFVFLVWVGLWVSRKGVEEGPEAIGDVTKYSGVAMLVALTLISLLRWNSGFSSADQTFWFRVAYLITMAVTGAKSLGMRRAGAY
jgi:hypothetical protein